MTDTAEAGSVAAEAQPAGAPATPDASAVNGSAAGADNPFSGLQDEGARKWVETKGYKNVNDVVTAAHSLEQRLGTAVTVPAADAPKEDWEKFYSRLPEDMRPVASPDRIEFKRPDTLPETVPYSEDLANESKSWMAESGLNPKQAQAMHDRFVGYMAEQALAEQARIAQSVEATHDDLVKDWGPMESEGFKQKHELTNRTMKHLGLVDAFKEAGILLPDGALTNPQIAKALVAVGERMFKEDTIGAGDNAGGENPFKRNADGTRNVMAISALVKSDPERAKRLAREAGEDPRHWISENPY